MISILYRTCTHVHVHCVIHVQGLILPQLEEHNPAGNNLILIIVLIFISIKQLYAINIVVL